MHKNWIFACDTLECKNLYGTKPKLHVIKWNKSNPSQNAIKLWLQKSCKVNRNGKFMKWYFITYAVVWNNKNFDIIDELKNHQLYYLITNEMSNTSHSTANTAVRLKKPTKSSTYNCNFEFWVL